MHTVVTVTVLLFCVSVLTYIVNLSLKSVLLLLWVISKDVVRNSQDISCAILVHKYYQNHAERFIYSE